MIPQEPPKAIFSEWLEKLQQESWQLELLISGFVIFGLFQGQGAIEACSWWIDAEAYGRWLYGAFFRLGTLLVVA